MGVRHGNFLDLASTYEDASFNAIISDTPYDFDDETKSRYLKEFRRLTLGTIILFGPPENQWPNPDQFCFWMKPISTKNTAKRYSRFVEVIHIYEGSMAVWNTGRNWANYINVFNDVVEANTEHPHQKPIALMERLVLNHTNPGELILDPFCGSGTTLVACNRNGRRCVGFEQDSKYASIAARRYEESWKS